MLPSWQLATRIKSEIKVGAPSPDDVIINFSLKNEVRIVEFELTERTFNEECKDITKILNIYLFTQ